MNSSSFLSGLRRVAPPSSVGHYRKGNSLTPPSGALRPSQNKSKNCFISVNFPEMGCKDTDFFVSCKFFPKLFQIIFRI